MFTTTSAPNTNGMERQRIYEEPLWLAASSTSHRSGLQQKQGTGQEPSRVKHQCIIEFPEIDDVIRT